MEPEKIIGWVDPSNERSVDTTSTAHDEQSISVLPLDDEPLAIENEQGDDWFEEDKASEESIESNEASIEIQSDNSRQTSVGEETAINENSLVIHADVAPSVHQSAINSMILDLELRNQYNIASEIYRSDITEFDVHRIQFEIQHAERLEALDFYQFIKFAYKVKLEALANMVAGKEDTPNLDALIAYLEAKYEESFE